MTDILTKLSTVSHLKATQTSRSDGELVQVVSDTLVFEKDASDGTELPQTGETLSADTPDDATSYGVDPNAVLVSSYSTAGSSDDYAWSVGNYADFLY